MRVVLQYDANCGWTSKDIGGASGTFTLTCLDDLGGLIVERYVFQLVLFPKSIGGELMDPRAILRLQVRRIVRVVRSASRRLVSRGA